MDRNEVKEILGRQLELLAEVSRKCCKPEILAELTKAMAMIAQFI